MRGSEPRAGSSATAHTSSEATSAKASATSAKAASAENDRASSTTSPVVLIVRLLSAHHFVTAVAARVGDIFCPYSVAT